MGEAKRRKTALKEKYGQEARIFPSDQQTKHKSLWSGAPAVLQTGIGMLVVAG